MDAAKEAAGRHGATGNTALLIIDMINTMDFEGAEPLFPPALEAARATARLREAADALKVPVIYVNDNYGHWHSERSRIVDFCRDKPHGRPLVEIIEPRPDDYFVIKPQFSGFYATTLQVLLPKLGVRRLVLTGVAADICVLFTAADAHMRAYDLWIPADTVASAEAAHKDYALKMMAKSMAADIRPTSEQTLSAWVSEPDQPGR